MTISQAFTELETIVKDFESGQLDLETYVPKFKRAVTLAKFLKTELKKIDTQIEEVNLEFEKDAPSPPASSEALLPENDSSDIPF